MAKIGDVRRCEHGKYWRYTETSENAFFCMMDRWEPLSRIWNPIAYRRAFLAVGGGQ
ncbi:hypothetical protein OG716_10530 [Nocardia sp. NBC_01388]